MKLNIYKINKEHIATLKEWGAKLMGELLEDAINSLKEENCICEMANIFYINDEPYLLGIMIPQKGKEIIKGPDSELNLKHREIFKSAILEKVSLETFYSLNAE